MNPPVSAEAASPRVHAEWGRRVAAEYGSAGVAAQVLTWSIQVGVDPRLLQVGLRVVADELAHAALAHTALVALGGEGAPVDVPGERLLVPSGRGVFADLVDTTLRGFCLGETLAVPYFAAMRREARHPAVRPVLDRVLEDEAVHRAFGWDLLDALITLDSGVPAYAAARLPALTPGFDGYRDPPDAPPLSAAERACGLLDHTTYATLFARTWEEEIRPRFARRGIALAPAAPPGGPPS